MVTDTFDLWNPAIFGADGIEVIHASNRYLTDIRDTDRDQIEVMGDDIDPEGFVHNAARGAYVYTSDNVVSYFKSVKTDGSER